MPDEATNRPVLLHQLSDATSRRGRHTADLIESRGDIDPSWLDSALTIGMTAGASAPPRLVQEVLKALAAVRDPIHIAERSTATETVRFAVPKRLRAP